MARDLNEAWGWIQKLIRRVSRLESGAMLENSSITNGRMRFIGGTLRVDSGGRVEIVGTLQIDGTTTVTGTFKVSGPWEMTGNGTITGNVTITGTVSMVGDMNVTGNINVTGSGRVRVGNMTLDPSSNGGSMKFSGGPEVYASGGMLGLYSVGSGGWIELDAAGARLYHGTRSVRVTSSGIQMTGLPTRASSAANSAAVGTLWSDSSGNLYRVVAG